MKKIDLARHCFRRLAQVGLLLGLTAGTRAAEALEVGYAEQGLASLRFAGHEFLAVAGPAVQAVVLETRTLEAGQLRYQFATVETPPVSTAWDAAQRLLLQEYEWGRASWSYRLAGDQLRLSVTLANRSAQTLANFDLSFLSLALPEGIAGLKSGGMVKRTLSDLVVLPLAWETGKLLLCVDTLAPPVQFGLGRATDAGKRIYPLVLRGGVNTFEANGVEMYPHGLPRLAAGASLTIEVSLRFAAAEVADHLLLDDLYAAFAALHPPALEWPDRRCIGTLFLPSRGRLSASNPRGWFNDPKLEVNTPEGLEAFRQQMLEYARRSAAVLTAMQAQGGIVWNLEGEENPHPISYIGDPRMTRLLAPEMDAVADQFFQILRDAGLRTGVTLRPTQVYFDGQEQKWKHGTGSHMDGRNPLADDLDALRPEGLPQWRFFPIVERMSRKIQYAKERWGCTLFYIDTNGIHVPMGEPHKFEWMLFDALTLKELQMRHPDVLLIPELRSDNWSFRTAYWAYSAPYEQLDYSKRVATPATVRRIYPRAFVVNHIANTKAEDLERWTPQLVEAVRAGDVLMHRGWFACSVNRWVKAYYDAARLLPVDQAPTGAELFEAVQRATVEKEPR